jgi:hypothetical protein
MQADISINSYRDDLKNKEDLEKELVDLKDRLQNLEKNN